MLAAGAWLWFDNLRAREAALAAGREACEAEGLQLLDDTVAATRMRLARDHHGRIAIRRTYAFEYTDTGNNRREAHVTLIGREVEVLSLGLPQAGNVCTLH